MAGVADGGRRRRRQEELSHGLGQRGHQTSSGWNQPEYNIAPMVVLALETVTRAGSVARVGRRASSRDASATQPRTHGERLPGDCSRGSTRARPDAARRRPLRRRRRARVLHRAARRHGRGAGIRAGGRTPVVADPDARGPGDAAGCTRLARRARRRVVACLDGQRGDVFLAAGRRRSATTPIEAARVADRTARRPTRRTARRAGAAWPIDRAAVIVGDGAGAVRETLHRAARPRARRSWRRMPLAEVAARTGGGARRAAQAPPARAARRSTSAGPTSELARERGQAPAAAP